jgi:hypothetical protein
MRPKWSNGGHEMTEITDQELLEIQEQADEATLGPWFDRHLDDDWATNLMAVSKPVENGPRWPGFRAGDIAAAVLTQQPIRYVDIDNGKWGDNAAFIAHAREDVPRLIEEIRRLRSEK